MGEFLKVLNFQEALEQIRQNFPSCKEERVPLTDACGRVLAEEILSPEDLPAFNRTVVDGYAVHAEDTFGCSESLPAFLDFAGEIKIGCEVDFSLSKGQCCWIPTGGMLPPGSNGAVMVEYTEKLGDDTVLVYRPVGPWENIMQKGEDIRKGQIVFNRGQLLRSQDIGLLASLGICEVDVLKPYHTGIISTGDEIIPVDQTPMVGQVRDVNSFSLAAAVKNCRSIPQVYPIIKDDFAILKAEVATAIQQNDIVIMSGGSSVGIMDVTLDVLLDFADAKLLFHGIAVKPGKPTMAVKIGDKLVIGLPGHPVSALMMFYIVCAPALKLSPLPVIKAQLTENIASQAGRDDFIPVQLYREGNEWAARPLLGKSGLMSILSMADGYIHIAYEKQGLKKGASVEVYCF